VGVIQSDAPPAPPPASLRSIVAPLTAIVLGTFMAILDVTVVNVALPTLQTVFGANLALMQWVITGYALAQAAVIPLAGWLSDRFGAKRLYVTSIVLFSCGSVLCAVAPSGEALVACRVLQGLGGGMLMPVGMSFVFRLAPPERRGAVMSAFGIPIMIAPALGPLLSGWLVEFADWRWIFFINVPVGVAAVVLAARLLPRLAAQRAAGALDLPGAALGPLAFAALTFGIAESAGAGWTGSSTLAGLGIGAVALGAFVLREVTTREPLLELRVFRSGEFRRAIGTQWLAFGTFFSILLLVPLYLQQVRGFGSFETGLTMLPQPLVTALVMPLGGRLFDRWGVRATTAPGLALTVVGLWILTQVLEAGTVMSVIGPLALVGAGMGLAMMSLGTHLLNSAPRDLVSRVTSLTSALQNVVASLAVAGVATVLQSRTAAYLAAGHGPEALPWAFGDTFRAVAVVATLACLLALTLGRGPRARGGTAEPGVRTAEN
jgi:EmrB/QacA subfamily drug resistance transporter